MTQPAASPTSLPVAADALAAEVVGQFAQAEQQLIDAIARVAARGFRDTTATAQLAMLQAMLSAARSIANQLRMQATPLARRIASIAAREGDQAAVAALRTAVMGDRRLADTYLKTAGGITGQGLAAANAIAVDLEHSLDATLGGIVRFANDAYRAATAEAATRLVLGRSGLTPLTAQARAWTELVGQGISGYTDSAGRRWNLTSYVEMATRTAVQRAYNAAHQARMTSVGIRYFTVPSDGHPCPLCRPWEGAVLSESVTGVIDERAADDGRRVTVNVTATISEARAAGLWHPNAILGDQSVAPIGEVENGVRAWYVGPSIHMTTARGIRLTVSPNHPVLTPTGWLPAKALIKGMHVFSARDGHRTEPTGADDDFDHVEPTIQDELNALAARGSSTRVAVTRNDLHGDGRFCQGEVEVVVADRWLLQILDAERVERTSELLLPRPDMKTAGGAGAGTTLLSRFGVGRAVGRTLPDLNVARLQAPTDRRAADAETVPEILSGLAADVELDELIDVQWDRYEGHAYDLQTTSGAYLAGSILVHNCRHVLLPYLPGVTRASGPKKWTADDQRLYDATQQLRNLERRVRTARRQEAGALDDLTRRRARRRAALVQAQIRLHVDRHGLVRRRHRERLEPAAVRGRK